MRCQQGAQEESRERSWSPVVAVAYPVTGRELRELGEAVAPDGAVVDLRAAPRETSVILCRPCSGQAVARLRREFSASVVIFVHDPWRDDARAGLADAADRHLEAGDAAGLARAVRAVLRQPLLPHAA